MSASTSKTDREDDQTERRDALQQLDDWLDTPMIFLSFVWLALLIVELVWGSIRLSKYLVRSFGSYSSWNLWFD